MVTGKTVPNHLLLFEWEIINLDDFPFKTKQHRTYDFRIQMTTIKSFYVAVQCMAVALLIGSFNSCSSLNEVQVVGKNFTDEIRLTQNLVFTFNKDLVPESKLNVWDSTHYIRFEPAVNGKFKWTAPNELVFSPTTTFGASEAYRAELTDQLLKFADKEKKYTVGGDQLGFHTPYLQLQDTETWWTRSQESARPEARLKLKFNYPVTAQNVVERLHLKLDDRPVDFKLLTSPSPNIVTLEITNPGNANPNPLPLQIILDKGLTSTHSSYVSKDPLEKSASLPSPLRLDVVDVQTGFESNRGFIKVITSQELAPESIAAGFSLTPELTPATEVNENGFVLRGDFNETDTYILQLNKSLKGILGPGLEEEVSRDLFFGKMPPGISFTNKKAIYLTPKGLKNIGVQIVNVPKVQVRIAKVYENNILNYVKTNRYENYDYIGESWQPTGSYDYNEDDQGLYSDVVVDKTVETDNLPRNKGISSLNVALPDDNGRKGIYLVSVRSKEEAYLGSTRLIAISDIGLIVKQGTDDLWVFANSIKTTEPLSDVEITLVSSNNQSVYTLKTDGNGMAHAEKLKEKAPGFRIAMITARSDTDFNYLLLEDTQVETSRFEVEGMRDNPSGLQAFIYGERDIYRPGETIHYNTVLRTESWKVAKDIPLKIKFITPNGKEYRTWRKSTNAQGAVETELSLDATALTGSYVLEVYNANDVLLASQAVSIEEFIPDRIKVDLTEIKKEYKPGEAVNITATALNLFGPPASNRTYEMESQLKRKRFFAAAYPEFSFDIPAETRFETERRQGITSPQGQAVEKFVIPVQYQNIGLLEAKVYVTVFDENSRPVNRLQRFDVITQPTLFGIRLPDTYVGINAPVPVEVIGVDSKGKLKKGDNVKIEIVRIDYQTIVEKQNEQLRYTSRKQEKVVYSKTVTLSAGRESIKYVPTVSGEYEIRVRDPRASYYSSSTFYAYGYGFTSYSSFEVSSEGRILMETDRTHYNTGQTAKVLFKTPFDGRLLVTVERNQVFEQHVLTTSKKAAELSIRLDDQYLPNVYVTATLIRPLDSSQLPLTVAHGFLPVFVEDAQRKLDVKIAVAPKSRSKTKQRVQIRTAPNAQLTVAVVDEGILQIKNFKTPDIHGHFYQKKALQVATHDLYALLFPELNFSGASSTGGDGYDLERRINPLSNGRKDLVRFWSGILTANSNGDATFDFAIPQFSGDLRVMAVAYKDNAFGSASSNMKVADPVVISMGAPRFLSPGDDLQLPVTISNTEKKTTPLTVSLQLEGPLSLQETGASRKIVIPPGKEERIIFKVKASSSTGSGKLIVKANTGGEVFVQETSLDVRPASPLLKTSSSGVIAGGTSGTIFLKSPFMPGTSRSQIVLSRSPLIQGGGKLFSDLLGYPYGCLEQVVSKAFPQIYFADLIKAMAKKPVYRVTQGESDFNPITNVQQAIRKTEAQQLSGGGYSLWPGSSKDDWWVSAYVLHFLEEARRANFEVNEVNRSKAIDYLTTKTGLVSSKEETPNLNEDGGPDVGGADKAAVVRRVVAKRESIYSLYVLALAGHPNRPAMNYYKQHGNLLTTDHRYLLAGAFSLIGDARSSAQLLPPNYQVDKSDEAGEDYASPIRNLSLTLNTLLETDRDNLQIPQLGRQLSEVVGTAPYLNTQEASFALLALGKIANRTAGSNVTAVVTSAGKSLGAFEGNELSLSKGILNQKLAVKTKGSGNLYWFAQVEGISQSGDFREEDQGLQVRRTYLTRDGKTATRFRQNDLVVVKISVISTSGLPIENVVVTDPLPAAFEIENPRLGEQRDMPWIKKASSPDYFDVRDDRIHFFTTANRTEKTFYYLARVISKGSFRVGPAAADAMYKSEYRSYSGAGKVTVE